MNVGAGNFSKKFFLLLVLTFLESSVEFVRDKILSLPGEIVRLYIFFPSSFPVFLFSTRAPQEGSVRSPVQSSATAQNQGDLTRSG